MFNRDRLVKSHLRTRFLVTLKTGEAFEGLLYEVDERTIVLVDAFAVDEHSRQSADGQVFLARDNVAYMQVPTVVAGVLGS